MTLRKTLTVKDAGTKPLKKGVHAYVTITDEQRDELHLASGYFSKWFENEDQALEYIHSLNPGDKVDVELEVESVGDRDYYNIKHLSLVESADGLVEDEKPQKAPEKPRKPWGEQIGERTREEALLLPSGYLGRVLGHYREAVKVVGELSSDKDVQLVLLEKISRSVNYLITDLARQAKAKEKSG